jgi:hypothetical protein
VERERHAAVTLREAERHRVVMASQSDRRFQRMPLSGPFPPSAVLPSTPIPFIGVQRQPKTVKLRRANIDKVDMIT